MSATETLPLWTPRRRRVFHGLAAIVTLAAACMYAGMGAAGYLSRGFDLDVFISATVCAVFLGGAATITREAKRKWPAAD